MIYRHLHGFDTTVSFFFHVSHSPFFPLPKLNNQAYLFPSQLPHLLCDSLISLLPSCIYHPQLILTITAHFALPQGTHIS